MSEGSISQEEIDALLSGVDVGGLGSGGSFNSAPEVDIDVPTLQNFSGTIKDKLAEVIKKNQGLANKDMAKFADQVNNLCDKWDR